MPLITVDNPIGIEGDNYIFNNDILNPVYIEDGSRIPGAGSSQIPALAGIEVSGKYMLSTAGGPAVQLDILPRGKSRAPSPAQISAQINALGLAKDASVNAPGYGPVTLANPGKLAVETGGNLQAQTGLLNGTQAGALVGVAGNTIGKEIAAWIAGGAVGAAPGGVPLLRGSIPVASASTAALAAGSGTTIGGTNGFSMLSPSYSLTVSLLGSASTAIMAGIITLVWMEGTVTTHRKSFLVVAGSVSPGHTVNMSGPVRGSALKVTFTNAATSGTTVTFTYTLTQTSQLIANDLCRTQTSISGPPTGVTYSGLNTDYGVLGNAAPSTGAGGTSTRGLAMYNGRVLLQANTASGTTDMQVTITAYIGLNTPTPNYATIYNGFSDAHGNIVVELDLPQFQCNINLINNNSSAKVTSFLVTTAEPNIN